MATPAAIGVTPSVVEGTRKTSRSLGGPLNPAPSTTGPSNPGLSTARSFVPRHSTPGLYDLGCSQFWPSTPRAYFARPFTPRHSTVEPYTPAPLTLEPYKPRPSTARPFTPQHSTSEPSDDECSTATPPVFRCDAPWPYSPSPSIPRPTTPQQCKLEPSDRGCSDATPPNPGCPSGSGFYNPWASTVRPVASGNHVDSKLVPARHMNRGGRQPQHVQPQRKPLISKKGRQNQKTVASDSTALPWPKKWGSHQNRSPRGVRPSIVHEDVREQPHKMPSKWPSSSTGSSSLAQTKRSAIEMKASSIGEHDIADLVNDIKSQHTNNGGGRLAKGGPWTAKEDEVLRLLVQDKGEGKWSAKANELNAMMREEYDTLEATARAKGETPEAFGRAAVQCLHRWKKVLKPGLNKGRWTTSEDERVRAVVHAAQAKGQPVKWHNVAEFLTGRIGKQCRERWFNHLDPTVKKTQWTPGEDEVLFHAQAYFGSRWCVIRRFIPGRTENAVKNRFNSAARNRWIDSTGTVLGGKTSTLFIQELLRTVNAKKEKEDGSGSVCGCIDVAGTPNRTKGVQEGSLCVSVCR